MNRVATASLLVASLLGVTCRRAPVGDGFLVGTECVSACSERVQRGWADATGYGFEARRTCVLPGSLAAAQNPRCTLTARTDLPVPGAGFWNGKTCFPACVHPGDSEGYGYEKMATCVAATSKAGVQTAPCVPPPPTLTGDCPSALVCPTVNGTTLACGCTWIEGLGARKRDLSASPGFTPYMMAAAMLETPNLRADYARGDAKTSDSFNAGICKQNWGMIRRCHPAWMHKRAKHYAVCEIMNNDLTVDVAIYNECRQKFGERWWSGHRAGTSKLGANTPDIQRFKAAMDWTNAMLDEGAGHRSDDVRFWVDVPAI